MQHREKCVRKKGKQNRTNFLKQLLIIVSIICVLLIICIGINLLSGFGGKDDSQNSISDIKEIDNPEEYTWEEYQKLTIEEQMIFPDYFDNMEVFNAWYENVEPDENGMEIPEIELNGRKPEEYTWEEYQELTIEEQMVFPDCFEDMEAFNAWYESVEFDVNEMEIPEIELNGRKPEEYTWEEYQNLTIEEQMVFPDYFDSMEVFNAWYNSVCPEK